MLTGKIEMASGINTRDVWGEGCLNERPQVFQQQWREALPPAGLLHESLFWADLPQHW